jgi:hypothetical protein
VSRVGPYWHARVVRQRHGGTSRPALTTSTTRCSWAWSPSASPTARCCAWSARFCRPGFVEQHGGFASAAGVQDACRQRPPGPRRRRPAGPAGPHERDLRPGERSPRTRPDLVPGRRAARSPRSCTACRSTRLPRCDLVWANHRLGRLPLAQEASGPRWRRGAQSRGRRCSGVGSLGGNRWTAFLAGADHVRSSL